MAGEGGRDVDREDWADTSEDDEGGVLPMGPPDEAGPRSDEEDSPALEHGSPDSNEEATP
jgi:hypothetical protein